MAGTKPGHDETPNAFLNACGIAIKQIACIKPAETLEAVYDFVGEKSFEHDFDNVEFDAADFDSQLGTPGLHRIDRQVKAEKRETVLPPDLLHRYVGDNFWNDPAANLQKVRVV